MFSGYYRFDSFANLFITCWNNFFYSTKIHGQCGEWNLPEEQENFCNNNNNKVYCGISGWLGTRENKRKDCRPMKSERDFQAQLSFFSFHSFFLFSVFFSMHVIQLQITIIAKNYYSGKKKQMKIENGPPQFAIFNYYQICGITTIPSTTRKEKPKSYPIKRELFDFFVLFIGQQNTFRQTKPKDWIMMQSFDMWFQIISDSCIWMGLQGANILQMIAYINCALTFKINEH